MYVTQQHPSLSNGNDEAYEWPFFLVPRYAGNSGDGMEEELTDVAGDTKAGTLIATDRYGNKYYENLEDELPCVIARNQSIYGESEAH
jgi:hypothetical protein